MGTMLVDKVLKHGNNNACMHACDCGYIEALRSCGGVAHPGGRLVSFH